MKALFVDQILGLIEASDGDSGSAVLNKDNNVIGMIIGTNKRGIIINKIDNILQSLDVSLCIER